MNSIELGKFLANLRNEKGLTQEELADKLFIDKRKVSRWECGTTIPEFDILIKLSEILDVSLYELSICKKLDKETLSTKTINKFKSIKDFKKYKLKRKIKIIASIVLLIIFIITLTYTIRNQGTVEIYELKSLDDNYYIKGNYIIYNDNKLLNIAEVGNKYDKLFQSNEKNCLIEISDENKRNYLITYYNTLKKTNNIEIKPLKKHKIMIKCNQKTNLKKNEPFELYFIFEKKYSNNIFSFY